MEHRLPGQGVTVDHHAEALVATQLPSQPLGDEEQMAGQRLVGLFIQVMQGSDVLPGE